MVNLAKSAYIIRCILKDEDLDIKFSGREITFTIFDRNIETDGTTYFKSKHSTGEQKIEIKDVSELYHYIMVQVTKNTGFKRHRSLTMKLEDLETRDHDHILRLSKEWSVPAEDVLEEITFTDGSPKEASKITTAAAKFIQSLAGKNRKRIIETCIAEGEDNYKSAL
jgi:hypothetical protein